MHDDQAKYYRYQTDICYSSKLYGDEIKNNGGKVLMLFAEIYSFIVLEYGLSVAPEMIINYENSETFKKWFWQIKHNLGNEIGNDPNFNEIGKWIGKGFFLKIILNLLLNSNIKNFDYYKNLIIKRVIKKQKELLNSLLKENYFSNIKKKAITEIENGYLLLDEKVILNYNSEYFFTSNMI